MRRLKSYARFTLSLLILWLGMDLARAAGAIPSTVPPAAAQEGGLPPVGATPATLPLYFPLVSAFLPGEYPRPELGSVFGVETHSWMTVADIPEIRANWIRRNAILWEEVEPVPGARNWEVLAGMEQEFIAAAEAGKTMVIIVRGAPAWARLPGERPCAAIRTEAMEAFGRFMADLVQRYSGPPYSVKYWEMWNEPDVAPFIMPEGVEVYGCWGDNEDPYYGGGHYAEMLKAVYPRVKAVDWYAQILVGGLLLGCNPDVEGLCSPSRGNLTPRFLEGILRNGGGDYFDGVSFHAYDYYGGKLGSYGNDGWGTGAVATGPAVLAKGPFLGDLLDDYGLSNKYLLNSETAIVFPPGECDDRCEQTKAFYVPQLYAATLSLGDRLVGSIWYSTLSNWRNVDLFISSQEPAPAHQAFNIAAQQFENATYLGQLDLGPGARGYAFDRDGHKLWVFWALNEESQALPLPGQVLSARDVFGQDIYLYETRLLFNRKPVYLEWTP